MAITASMVKELREMTGAGMMDCKKALNETNGDMDAAVEFLRKNGQAKAEKKASRIAAEGVARAAISADGKTACVIEVNSETDFVAKNETFTSFVEAVNGVALASDLQGGKDGEDIEALLATPFEGATVKEALVEKTATIGEKLSIRRFEKVSGDVAVSYIHGGGRIGVIVAANGASDDAAREALTNIAMQVAAMNPTYISRNDISAEELAKLQEITVDAALNDPASLPKPILNKLIDKAMNSSAWSDEDKAIYEEKKSNMNYLFNFLSKEAAAALAELAMADKDAIVSDKIFKGLADGRVSKQLKEICLLDQTYVKAEDGKQSVGKYVEQVAKENNGYALADLYDQNGTLLAKKGQLLNSFALLRDDGSTASSCWIYTGSWTEQGNQMANRDNADPSGLGNTLGWAWAWPLNRRVLYNRASADINGKPWDAKRMLIQWNGSKWVGNDIPDFNTAPPGSKTGPFIMQQEGLGRLFALDKLAEGPFPEHPAWH